jgi:hypothetical protein
MACTDICVALSGCNPFQKAVDLSKGHTLDGALPLTLAEARKAASLKEAQS